MGTRAVLLIVPIALIGASACATAASGGVAGQTATAPSGDAITVHMNDRQSQDVGEAIITSGLAPSLASSPRTASMSREGSPDVNGVTITVLLRDLPAGTHGFHVNAVGRCDAPDFASAGRHLNPGNRSHGVMSPSGPHAGDLPNLTADSDGTAVAEFFVGHLSMSQIMSSPSGASLVIDANPDDDITMPDGNSGAHIACGVIRPGTAPPSPSPSPSVNAFETVSFSGLPPGSHVIHLHSTCNGNQSFHIAVIGTLMVDASGQGDIAVPTQDFGHGWCLIVYANSTTQSVLTMEQI